MLNSQYSSPTLNSSSFPDDTCRRCGSSDLFVKPQKQHLGLFCRQCQLWQKWIRRSQARHWQASNVALTKGIQPSQPNCTLKRFQDEPTDFSAEIDDLNKRVVGIERVLAVVLRAILSCGVLQGRKVPPAVSIDDELITRFVEGLNATD